MPAESITMPLSRWLARILAVPITHDPPYCTGQLLNRVHFGKPFWDLAGNWLSFCHSYQLATAPFYNLFLAPHIEDHLIWTYTQTQEIVIIPT